MPLDARRVQALFLEAVEVDSAARAAILHTECAGDRELRRRVEALLRAHDEPDSMLDKAPGEAPDAPPETLQRIDPFIQRFEKAWQSGTPPAIDDFLPKEGPDRLAVLKELIMVDRERRRQAGTPARAHDYLQRYPELTRHFPTQQQDPPIQAATLTHDSAGERAGTVVAGRYKLLEQIGEGGMGTVWVAEQTQPVRRKVALKLIKAGMDSKTVLARFEAERQALALMDHPNIAKVLDGGTVGQAFETDISASSQARKPDLHYGRPFFVMEYVKGIPLTKYCDDARLSIAERLALFMPVCHAVQHAHQKGIIHRDLKPSNILVCLYDGVPLPKVIDFGLAKAMYQPLTEHTLHTAHGMMTGTPLYMSPEQTELNNLDVDTRTDVYSLGVILYELLTGTTPLERKRLKEAAWQEMLRLIKEEEPPRPSTRLSGSGMLPTVAAQRKLEPAKLTKLVQGDLDWIAMKALEKERARRYETANALSRDIQRYLSDEPVEACPPSRSYRLRKFASKNRAALLTVAALSGVAIVALVGLLLVGLFYQEQLKGEKAKTEQALQLEETAHKTAETARLAETKALGESRHYLYNVKLVLAEREWTVGNVTRVNQLLQDCPPEVRGWEWNYLDHLSRRPLASVQGPVDNSSAVAFSPDGKWAVTGGTSLKVRFWDTSSGQMTHQLDDDGFFPVYGLALSPDAKLLASVVRYQARPGGDQFHVKLWDVETRKEIQELKGFRGERGFGVRDFGPGVIFSPDGQWLALASHESDNQLVTLWDVKTRELVHTLTGYASPLSGMAFSPDSQRLAYFAATPRSARRNRPLGGMKVWETKSGSLLDEKGELPVAPNGAPVFSPDGKQLAFPAEDAAVHIWDAQTLVERAVFRAENESPYLVAYSPDGKLLASTGGDGIVHLWDPVSRLRLRSLRGDVGWLLKLSFSPDGRRLLTCNELNRLTVWDPHTGQDPLILPVNSDPLLHLAVSPDGNRLACGNEDGATRVWDTVTGQLLLTLRGYARRSMGVAFSPDGSLLATGSHANEEVKLWDVATGRLRRTLALPLKGAAIFALNFTSDGKHLAVACRTPLEDRDKMKWLVYVLSVASGVVVCTLDGHTQLIWDVTFSPDTKRLVSASDDKTARVWDMQTGKQLACFRGHSQPLRYAKFSPDGQRIASTSADKTVKIWDAVTGDELRTLVGHTGGCFGVAFSRDGRRIASGSDDGTVKIWDAVSGEELLTLRGHQDGVAAVVFGPEDRWLASLGRDRTVRVWEATPLTAERRLQREAVNLVNRLAEEVDFKDEMRSRLRADPSLSEPLRAEALTLAEHYQDDPWRLNRGSRVVVERPGLDKAKYQLALRQAETALSLAPPGFNFHPNFYVTTNIGIAHYRLGNYREAIENLTNSEAYYTAGGPYEAGTPWNLSFLAMAHHQLGDKDKAQALLDRVREIIKDPVHKDRDDVRSFFREAVAVVYQGAGRLRDGVAYLAKAFANPQEDMRHARDVAALQAWFGQEKDLGATCEKALAFAKDTKFANLGEWTAEICSLGPADAKRHEAALDLARRAIKLGAESPNLIYFQLALGMAEYRSGHFAEADAVLATVMNRGKEYPIVLGPSAYYRAMSLFQQGKPEEARKLASEAARQMKPLPKDGEIPLATGVYWDLVLWLAYKEARTMIQFDAAPPAKAENDKK
jgi:WD40 repeat protein/serine/threonine protein kinase/tetratricopeptide (TPR) repeat protein